MSEIIDSPIDPHKPKINNKFNHGGDVFNAEQEGNSLIRLQQLMGFDFTDVVNPVELLQIFNDAKSQGLIVYNENGERKCYVKPQIESKLNVRQYLQVRTQEFKAWFGDRQCQPESASKVVDEYGEPLVVYHGSRNLFDTFDISRSGSGTDPGYFGYGIYFTGNKKLATKYMKNGPKGKDGIVFDVFINIKNIFKRSNNAQNVCLLDKGIHNMYRPNSETRKLEIHHQWEISEEFPFTQEIIAQYNYRYNTEIKDLNSVDFEYVYEKNKLGNIMNEVFSSNGYHGLVATNPLSNQMEYIVFDSKDVKSATLNHGKFSSKTDNIYD